MTGRIRLGLALALVAGCAAAVRSPAVGKAATAPADAAELKTGALHGVLEELNQRSDRARMSYDFYLDSLVGPTPEEYLYEWSHPHEWLEAMVATKLVDRIFGVGEVRGGPTRLGVAIEIGEPYPAGGDTLEVAYDFCLRGFPAERGTGGPPSSWRDAFVKADTGWTRVRHAPAIFLAACRP